MAFLEKKKYIVYVYGLPGGGHTYYLPTCPAYVLPMPPVDNPQVEITH